MNWSDYQEAIFAAARETPDSLLIDAKAGSGKTCTQIKAMDFIDPFGRSVALAFNKSIANILARQVPQHVEAKTINALGHRICMQNFPGAKLVAWKSTLLLKQVIPNNLHDQYLDAAKVVYRHGRAWGMGVFEGNSIEGWEKLINPDTMDIPVNLNTAQLAAWLFSTLQRQFIDKKTIDFDDQIAFPLYHDCKLPKFDSIFIDEAQDLSPLQHQFIDRTLPSSGRLIAVGDPHQAIYGFRGADTNSMAHMRKQFSMTPLPLSISYRCSREVIYEAQNFVPNIEVWDEAKEGAVNEIPFHTSDISLFKVGDLVLCRNNAPLISLGLRFIAEQKPVHVRGNFEAIIFNFIDSFKTDNFSIFSTRLEAWYEEALAEAEGAGLYNRIAGIQDKYDGVKLVMEQTKSVEGIKSCFRNLFRPKSGTILSTIHRAKGEEAEDVYLLRPELLPSKYAQTQAQLQQEYNLQYVAITRAKNTFTYLTTQGEG
jgi:superfamily I DNA/RNA helicase